MTILTQKATRNNPSSEPDRSEIFVNDISTSSCAPDKVGACEQDIAPAGPERDERIKALLDSIQSDWQPSELGKFIDEFIQELALDPHPPSTTEIDQYFQQLIRKLKAAGYSSLKKDDYFRMLKDARKIVEGSQRAADTKEGATHALEERFKVDDGEDGRCGIWDRQAGKGDGDFITNFTVVFDRDIEVLDDIASQRKFKGTLKILGRELPFEIPHEEYASDNGLREMIFKVAGAEAR